MVDVNGQVPHPAPTQPSEGPQLAIPVCRLLYQQLPNGARVVVGVDIGGLLVGGVISASTGYDARLPTKEHQYFAPLTLVTHWPFEWKNVTDKDLVAVTQMPPEPRFPRR